MPTPEPKPAGVDTTRDAHSPARTKDRMIQEVEELHRLIVAREINGGDALRHARSVLSLAEQLVHEQRAGAVEPDQLIDGLGRALRAIRLERRLTLSALHSASGIHLNTVGGVERGERNPTFRQITQLANALSVPVDELARRAILACE